MMIFEELLKAPVSLICFLIINSLLITGLFIGKIVMYKNENLVKFFAYLTVVLSILLGLYFISILWFTIESFVLGKSFYIAFFPVFIFLPFVIGRFASYEKIHFYTNVQLGVLILSLALGLIFALYFV